MCPLVVIVVPRFFRVRSLLTHRSTRAVFRGVGLGYTGLIGKKFLGFSILALTRAPGDATPSVSQKTINFPSFLTPLRGYCSQLVANLSRSNCASYFGAPLFGYSSIICNFTGLLTKCCCSVYGCVLFSRFFRVIFDCRIRRPKLPSFRNTIHSKLDREEFTVARRCSTSDVPAQEAQMHEKRCDVVRTSERAIEALAGRCRSFSGAFCLFPVRWRPNTFSRWSAAVK